jgi:hypothetical protein
MNTVQRGTGIKTGNFTHRPVRLATVTVLVSPALFGGNSIRVSDERAKHTIEPINDALARLTSLTTR